jgi:hypothetical protein
VIERDGDKLALRLGPGHFGVIVSIAIAREPALYRQQLAKFHSLSHITVEVRCA